jgi:hypothetical protein
MISSVFITGDAGGLNYIDEKMNEVPRKSLNLCCSECTLPPESTETNLVPISVKSIKKEKVALPFSWTPHIIKIYSNTKTMKKDYG